MNKILLNRVFPQKLSPGIDILRKYEKDWHCLVCGNSYDVAGVGIDHMVVIKTYENEYLVYGYLDEGHDALWYEVIYGHEHLQNYKPGSKIIVEIIFGRRVTLHYISDQNTVTNNNIPTIPGGFTHYKEYEYGIEMVILPITTLNLQN